MGNSPLQAGDKVSVALSRELGLFDLVMMGVGMMIGAGAVLGMGESVRIAGAGGALLAFLLNGALAFVVAMAYAEMSSAIPKAGSIYNFARIGIGRGTGFMAGWTSWFASAVAGSLYASLCSIYLIHYLNQLGLLEWVPLATVYQERALAALLAAFFVWVNYRGVAETGKAQNVLTLAQMAALGLIALAGAITAAIAPSRLENFRPFLPNGLTGVWVCMGFGFVAFEGFEVIATAGDETINPRRTLPKAILASVVIVTVTYLAVGAALILGVKETGMPAWEWLGAQGEKGFGEAMARFMPFGWLLATLTVVFASMSALNATVYAAARASYALGRDGMLPRSFGRISPRRRTPHVALGFTALIVAGCAAFLPIFDVASSASILFLFMFLLANVCVIRIRRHMAEEMAYGYRMPFVPFLPVAAIFAQAALAVYIVKVSWIAWVVAPTWCALGLGVYFAYARRRAIPIREEILTLEESPEVPAAKRRLLFPVRDPEAAVRLIPFVGRLAEARGASIELLHMVTLPEQVPLADAPLHAMEGKEAIAEAMLHLSPRFPVNAAIRYCRTAARGILAEARKGRSDLIVVNWQRPLPERPPVPGPTAWAILRRARCDVVALRGFVRATFGRALVVLTGGRGDALARETALAFLPRESGKTAFLRVLPPGRKAPREESPLPEGSRNTARSLPNGETRTAPAADAAQAIVQESADADVIVIGIDARDVHARLGSAGLFERIASLSDKPLAVVRAAGGSGLLRPGHWRVSDAAR